MNAFISNYLEPFAYLIFTIALYMQCRMNKSVKIKVLVIYYVLATLLMTYASLPSFYIYSTKHSNNNWIYNISYFLTIFFYSFYMYKTFISVRSKIVTVVLLFINIVTFFINHLIFKQQLFDSFASSISILSLIILFFLYFQQVLSNVSERNILLDFDFLLISGNLPFFLGSFLIIIFWSHLSSQVVITATKAQRGQFNTLWSLHNILLFLSASIVLISNIWIISYKKKLR